MKKIVSFCDIKIVLIIYAVLSLMYVDLPQPGKPTQKINSVIITIKTFFLKFFIFFTIWLVVGLYNLPNSQAELLKKRDILVILKNYMYLCANLN